MHFSEDDLREALKRKDPGEGFTQRVMARVNQANAERTTQTATKKVNGKFLSWWMHRPAWAVAVVAMLLLAFGIGGYQYSEYRHAEENRIARRNSSSFSKRRSAPATRPSWPWRLRAPR